MANLCDDIHALANRWDKLADTIHNRKGDNADHRKVAAEDRKLIPPSRELVALCRKDTPKVKAWGNQLAALLDEYAALNNNDSWDDDVAVIDKMVDVLDKLTHYCDEH